MNIQNFDYVREFATWVYFDANEHWTFNLRSYQHVIVL